MASWWQTVGVVFSGYRGTVHSSMAGREGRLDPPQAVPAQRYFLCNRSSVMLNWSTRDKHGYILGFNHTLNTLKYKSCLQCDQPDTAAYTSLSTLYQLKQPNPPPLHPPSLSHPPQLTSPCLTKSDSEVHRGAQFVLQSYQYLALHKQIHYSERGCAAPICPAS